MVYFPCPSHCTSESLLWLGRVHGPLRGCSQLSLQWPGALRKGRHWVPRSWWLLPALNTLLRDPQESLGTVLCVISLLSRGDSKTPTVNAQRYWGSGITSAFPSLCWRKIPSSRIQYSYFHWIGWPCQQGLVTLAMGSTAYCGMLADPPQAPNYEGSCLHLLLVSLLSWAFLQCSWLGVRAFRFC